MIFKGANVQNTCQSLNAGKRCENKRGKNLVFLIITFFAKILQGAPAKFAKNIFSICKL